MNDFSAELNSYYTTLCQISLYKLSVEGKGISFSEILGDTLYFIYQHLNDLDKLPKEDYYMVLNVVLFSKNYLKFAREMLRLVSESEKYKALEEEYRRSF